MTIVEQGRRMSAQDEREAQAARLRDARLAAGFETASDFARHVGVPIQTYLTHENGARGFRLAVAQNYAPHLRVDPLWLLTGRDLNPVKKQEVSSVLSAVRQVPIYSWVSAGKIGSSDPIDLDGDGYMDFAAAPPRAFCLKVNISSLNRIAPSGAFLLIDPDDRAPRDGRYYVVCVDGETTARKYRDTDGPVRLEPDSTDPHPTLYPAGRWDVIGRIIQVSRRV